MRKKTLIIATAVAAALSLTVACNPTDGDKPRRPNETTHEGLPPKRFQGDVEVGVRFVSNPEAACYEAGLKDIGSFVKGCTIETIYRNKVTGELFSNYVMIVRNPCKSRSKNDDIVSYCHEVGHVNTWPRNHPA